MHYIQQVTDADIEVHRNDKINIEEIEKFDKILLSPGPGLPSQAGILSEVIKTYSPSKSILGICLGMQAIAEVFGASLSNLKEVFHGVATPAEIIIDDILFKNIPKQLMVGRYHSWVVNKNSLPNDLEITCINESADIMALRHKKYDVRGVQFHPESILTMHGLEIIKNWVSN